MTEKDFTAKWSGIKVDDMTNEQLTEYKNDCFDMYEETGFLEKFDSPYDDIGGGQHKHNGMGFKVLRRATVEECDLEAMPLWFVEFENGDTAYCYPEEICALEKKPKNKGISLMSPDEIRDLLADQYNWDVEDMAEDHQMTVKDVTGLLQRGGEGWQKRNAQQAPAKPQASYDVAFAPMVNVRFTPEDPSNLSEKEQNEIINLAKSAVAKDFGEKISAENVSMIRLYKVDGDVPGTERNHYIVGNPEYDPIDPEILVEVTNNLYECLYNENPDGIQTSHTLIELARKLTGKYRNTDWHDGGHDFWITMDEEAEAFLKGQTR